MNSTFRIGTASAAVLLIATLGACAASTPRTAANSPGKGSAQDLGLATRAQMALVAGTPATAVPLAERAVELNARDVTLRNLLGNCYFAAGRFASAEAAYRDSLTLQSNQPAVVLKMVLVSIAQGKNGQALGLLEAARNVLDPSDYGLAMALAGRPEDAAGVLRQAAQQVGADSRVRQNLALALALSGDWTGARSVAAQDVTPDQLDARIQSWMQMAKPSRTSDQVAALTGISPAATDPGQPVRLALQENKTQRLAAIAPVVEPAPPVVAAPAQETVAPPPALAQAAPVSLGAEPVFAPSSTNALPYVTAPDLVAQAQMPLDNLAPRPALSPRAAALTDPSAAYAQPAFLKVRPRSRAVVQLGAYADRTRVDAAWHRASAKYASLRGYMPVAARYDGERGTVFRLAVQGFSNARQAIDLCGSLKRAGATCFVRYTAGDRPVQMASR